eukprot:TRINITY_DN23806_c0_g1_i2.p1 TRINITY_DN23806_c0_g1~~TRINITY_DN23806_c0_g1_i2.p1  ORF type:complete len:112 (-),score=28.16 TRINITY_DN23806_c0_g1_i2:136-471(-)
MSGNLPGSTAGAGSGEFHRYRNLRRKELLRLQKIDEDAEREERDKEFSERARIWKEKEEARTAKRADKRKRKRGNRQQRKAQRTKEPHPTSSSESEPEDTKEDTKETTTTT